MVGTILLPGGLPPYHFLGLLQTHSTRCMCCKMNRPAKFTHSLTGSFPGSRGKMGCEHERISTQFSNTVMTWAHIARCHWSSDRIANGPNGMGTFSPLHLMTGSEPVSETWFWKLKTINEVQNNNCSCNSEGVHEHYIKILSAVFLPYGSKVFSFLKLAGVSLHCLSFQQQTPNTKSANHSLEDDSLTY
jgi:hypothetical protein